MALIDEVKQICTRLAPLGWRDLLLRHGLNITASDLANELSKPLSNIDRTLPGFEDFALEGIRGIEPSNPARSLLFHALASANVVTDGNGQELQTFPTLAEIQTVENYVYGVRPPSIEELRQRFPNAVMAIAVFASEYRPAPETVHKKHADKCFSRTGVARVGTEDALYDSKLRGFIPFVEGNDQAVRVLPSQFAPYIAVRLRGNRQLFGPMRFRVRSQSDDQDNPQVSDATLNFWVPIYKLFNGTECIRGLNLEVTLEANHINEKLYRVHRELRQRGFDTGWQEPEILQPPFIFTEAIAELSQDPELGTGLVVPIVHPAVVEAAQFQGQPLGFRVPPTDDVNVGLLSSSLSISVEGAARPAPEYVHIRHQLNNGQIIDLNNDPNLIETLSQGGYEAQHYIDFTADGWIRAICPQLQTNFPNSRPAYSLVAAPDYFPNCDQRELLEWWRQSVPSQLQQSIWRIDPETLSDDRYPPNLQLQGADFAPTEVTITALVSLPLDRPARNLNQRPLNINPTQRHSYLPDAAAGVFAPGWDVTRDRFNGVTHLAAYGLGSPFPEDAKLCAALSTFWPAVAPDAARTFEPNLNWPTVTPQTDEEIGQVGNLPWDGVPGPRLITENGVEVVEYSAIDYVDYVKQALDNKFSLALTSQVDVEEYKARILAMARAYRALGIREEEVFRPGIPENSAFGQIVRAKAAWSLLSFRRVDPNDPELLAAQREANRNLAGDTPIYRFQLYRHGQQTPNPENFQQKWVRILSLVTLFVDPVTILRKQGSNRWESVRNV